MVIFLPIEEVKNCFQVMLRNCALKLDMQKYASKVKLSLNIK